MTWRAIHGRPYDAALEEVRPYLIADGGNVDVVGIEDGIVAVRMNGACGRGSHSSTSQFNLSRV